MCISFLLGSVFRASPTAAFPQKKNTHRPPCGAPNECICVQGKCAMAVKTFHWIFVLNVCLCRFVYAELYNLMIHSMLFLPLRDMHNLNCMLLHVCAVSAGPDQEQMMGCMRVCVCVRMCVWRSLWLPWFLSLSPPPSHSPLPLSLLSFSLSPPSLGKLKRHLPLTHAIALCSESEAAILTLHKDVFYPCEIKF